MGRWWCGGLLGSVAVEVVTRGMRRWVDRRAAHRWSTGMAVASALAVAVGCGGSSDQPTAGTSESDDPATVTSSATDSSSTPSAAPGSEPEPESEPAPEVVTPQGFSTVMVEVTDADGEVCEVCVWLADSAEERSRGLMEVTDLGGAAGMLFSFGTVAEHRFYMLGTPTPLSIAWFGPDGAFVSSTDMEPCLDPPAGGCPLYVPGGPARAALEVFAGGLDALGVGPGAELRIVADSEADSCPTL